MPHLAAIYRYPLKSGAAQTLSTSLVTQQGLEHDRAWMVATPTGVYLTGRTHPQLLLVKTELNAVGITFSTPDQPPLFVASASFNRLQTVQVWSDEFNAQTGVNAINAWFSSYLAEEVIVVWIGEQSQRRVRRFPETPISFVDGYPILVIGEGSLAELNRRAGQQFDMLRFRPNLVIADAEPFAEDHWQQIRIGDVILNSARPCERCVMITLDPYTAEKDKRQEPLRTLAKFRKTPDGVLFGQHFIASQPGQLALGMPLEVIA
jgi:uncharacterized protein YcbX